MKILFCANIYDAEVVGPARLVETILKINHIYNGIHEVRVLTADVQKEKFPIYKMIVNYPRPLRFFDFIFLGWSFCRGIIRVKKEFDFDVILFGNVMSGLISKILNPHVPIVGFLNDYKRVGLKIQNIHKTEGGLALFLHSFVEKMATKKLNHTIVCSRFLKNMVIKNYRVQPERIFHLYQSIDVAGIPFSIKEINENDKIKILFVKIRHMVGGLHHLAEALSMLTDYRFEATIIGPDIAFKNEVYNMFVNLSHVRLNFIGPSTQSEVHRHMKLHHILCIPSLIEGQGLANVEGLAHGLCVVSSNAGGIPEVLNYGENGWMSRAGDSKDLAEKIRECIETDSEIRQVIGIRGRVYAKQNFDCPVMLEKLIDFLGKNI